MTEAGSMMRRLFEQGGREPLADDQAAALTGLAASVRTLIATVVLTDADEAEVDAVTREVDALTRRLAVATRTAPPLAQLDETGTLHQPAGPVTGPLNPIAPPITIDASPDGTANAAFTLGVVYEGPPGFVHGGVSAMILDHLSGTAVAATGVPGMTARLDLTYCRPTPHSEPLTAEARIVRATGRRKFVESRILGPDGQVTVEATALFVMPPATPPAGE